MPVGAQSNAAATDQSITDLTVALTNVFQMVTRLNTFINGGTISGISLLTQLGYANTPNAQNPNNWSDATYALNMIAYLNTMAQVWNGQAAQTPAFNFCQELAQMTAGKLG